MRKCKIRIPITGSGNCKVWLWEYPDWVDSLRLISNITGSLDSGTGIFTIDYGDDLHAAMKQHKDAGDNTDFRFSILYSTTF